MDRLSPFLRLWSPARSQGADLFFGRSNCARPSREWAQFFRCLASRISASRDSSRWLSPTRVHAAATDARWTAARPPGEALQKTTASVSAESRVAARSDLQKNVQIHSGQFLSLGWTKTASVSAAVRRAFSCLFVGAIFIDRISSGKMFDGNFFLFDTSSQWYLVQLGFSSARFLNKNQQLLFFFIWLVFIWF